MPLIFFDACNELLVVVFYAKMHCSRGESHWENEKYVILFCASRVVNNRVDYCTVNFNVSVYFIFLLV